MTVDEERQTSEIENVNQEHKQKFARSLLNDQSAERGQNILNTWLTNYKESQVNADGSL